LEYFILKFHTSCALSFYYGTVAEKGAKKSLFKEKNEDFLGLKVSAK
jgi:hypothetical protein